MMTIERNTTAAHGIRRRFAQRCAPFVLAWAALSLARSAAAQGQQAAPLALVPPTLAVSVQPEYPESKRASGETVSLPRTRSSSCRVCAWTTARIPSAGPLIRGSARATTLFDGDQWRADDVKEVDSCDSSGNDYDDCPSAPKHQLSVRISSDSIESGRDEFGREFTEQVVVQYYASEEIFENEVRLANETTNGWVARRRPSGRQVTLWFVVRDDRGGVSWTERRVTVQ